MIEMHPIRALKGEPGGRKAPGRRLRGLWSLDQAWAALVGRRQKPDRSLTRNSLARMAVLFGLCAALASGCYRVMVDQPKYRGMRPSTFFADGLSARQPIAGTVARGHLNENEAYFTGQSGGVLVPVAPIEVTPAVLERGRERFNIFCTPCHGALGDGRGMIVQRGFPPPPSYHIDRLRQAPDGHYFSVMTNGFGRMYDYASRISVEDRWAIITYIRALQLSQSVPLNEIPEAERQNLAGTTP